MLKFFARLLDSRAMALPALPAEPRPAARPIEVFPKNAPGDFYTTGECMACETPEQLAPGCLAPLIDGNADTYFLRQPQTLDEIEHVCRAAESCCVEAIRYRGADPAIRRRLPTGICD